ncbi:hypothetical protein K0M31_003311 [Melipona bicolor]|uniref:Uncharacterized protein n=1 Tax=Melipona bicolor TaxID=60889 RepID=A0AA40FYI4_9HYME|nr:hypothetical protein K0M31_003311 [Melipona bicolor]
MQEKHPSSETSEANTSENAERPRFEFRTCASNNVLAIREVRGAKHGIEDREERPFSVAVHQVGAMIPSKTMERG